MRIQRLLRVLVCFSTTFFMSNALADTCVCTRQQAQEAESVAATAKSWQQLHQQFERYEHCDDGAIAEGFSESVSLLLAKDWESIDQLKVILESDFSFLKFVLRHIDESVPADRLKQIAENAGKQCPRNLKKLCGDIEAAALQH